MTKLIIAFRCVANIPKKGFSLNVDVFPGGKERPGRDADPSPTSTAVVNKEQSYTSTPPMGRTACTQPQCQYSTAIPLLPLWAVRPVQSLIARRRVNFTFLVTFLSTMKMDKAGSCESLVPAH